MKPALRSLALILLAACVALPTASAAAGSRSVRATYAGTLNGMSIGVITEVFETDGATYRIVSDTRPIGLAVLLQRQPLRFVSRGHLTRDGLKPAHFEARRSANDPPQVSAEFDWSQGQVTLRHNGKMEAHAISIGTQDRLSIMYQFMFMRLARERQVEFAMTNGRKLDRYRYRVTPDVEIDTALGRLKTLHLVKEREQGDTAAEVWLSPQHQNVAVKIVIVERDGMRFEQAIQSVEFRD
ncbi:MAG TPA: DUF3108 domain-containing protein [Burkholderiales bacterium]|nr:DUF3108 domain-containing protein [Burkholderiales bacterium]